MKILVTGGAGFIGSHVVDRYIAGGHSVVVVDNLSIGDRKNVNLKAKFYQADIRDKDSMKMIFSSEKIDILNHHAAQMDVRRSVVDPILDADINVMGLLNLLQCAATNRVKKIIFASSGGAIYGEQNQFPADENHPTIPLSPYGITKLISERYLIFYQQFYGIHYVILRYANVFGPRQNPHGEAGVIAIFTKKMLNMSQPVINGDGRQTRDYVYVGDIARINELALQYEKNDIFNVGTGVETDVNKLFTSIGELCQSTCFMKHGPAKKGEQLRSVISYLKAQRLLNWKPEITLSEGLRLTVDYFKANPL